MILLFVFLIPLLTFSDESSYYVIYRNNIPVAYSEIKSSGKTVSERVLWFDGYSKEYSETKFSFNHKITYSSEIYYEDNKLPIICSLNDGVFIKTLADKRIKTKIDSKSQFIHKNSNLGLFLCFLTENSREILVFDSDKMNSFKASYSNGKLKVNNNESRVFKEKNSLFDSAFIFNFKLVKSKYPIEIKNPYRINLSNIYTEKDFTLKKHHLAFKYFIFSGELSYDALSDTIVVILPFSFSSDYNGNLGTLKSFSVKQIAENIKYPVLSLEIDKKNSKREFLSKEITMLEKELLKSYSRIVFIAFNDICLDLCKSSIKSKKIFVNPPLLTMKEWSDMMFKKYSAKSKFLFSSNENFIKYENLNISETVSDMIKSYSESKNSYFIFSQSVLTDKESENAKKIKGTVFYIKNIDRRFNSYNIYDLWSFESSIYIDKKIFGLIGGIIKK